MPSAAYKAYVQLLKQLESGRLEGTLSENEEKQLRERMDCLWWSLTAKEAETLDKRRKKSDCSLYSEWS